MLVKVKEVFFNDLGKTRFAEGDIMGGLGSGRYGAGYSKGKECVENKQIVSIGVFSESLNTTYESLFTIHSPSDIYKVIGSGTVNPVEKYIQFHFSNLVIRIYVDKTPCHFGGDRYWFVCPSCSRKCSKVYIDKIGLACRKCCDLNYFSQQHTKTDSYYYQRKAEQVARKIDRDYKYNGIHPIFPPKPKYMKWSAYGKLYRQFHDSSERSYQVWLQGASRILWDRRKYLSKNI